MRAACLKLHFILAVILAAIFGLCLHGCSPKGPMFPLDNPLSETDFHSYARPAEWRATSVSLDLDADFSRKALRGTAVLEIVPGSASQASAILLDTRDLRIEKAEWGDGGGNWSEAKFSLGANDPVLGAPLRIEIPPDARAVRVTYETSPAAAALQWLDPAQTAGKKYPFLFSQSQAIQARSWIPLQDSPGIRVTYRARIRVPAALRAVMSANMDPFATGELKKTPDGEVREYVFEQPHPIPSYLIALAAGNLTAANLDPQGGHEGRTAVYAEPSVLPAAAREFADTEKMIEATEARFGPYRWGRYDLLVLPPSFPFGGMENPNLTFATPTVIAGDKSLVSLVAHELAHSWSGNLVTNATWRDFWLNEGVTTYLERRVIEDLYGGERADMEAVLGYQTLLGELKELPDKDEILYVDLRGRDPDDGFTNVPYEKGALFLRTIESVAGREKFDKFLHGYFDRWAFQSITTQDFLNELERALFRPDPTLAAKIPVLDWVTKPGIPAGAVIPQSSLLEQSARAATEFAEGKVQASEIPFRQWSSQEQLFFLRALPKQLDMARMRSLDEAFALTRAGNSEVVSEWLLMAVRNRYTPADARLESFLIEVGRRKFLKPLYEELVKTPEGRARATAIYAKARAGYHPMAVSMVDGILNAPAK